MGIDWYSCHSCGETFPDCGRYVSCQCGHHWCSDECAEDDGFTWPEEHEDDDEYKSCKYCRDEDMDDWELVPHLLEALGLTRKEAVAKIRRTT